MYDNLYDKEGRLEPCEEPGESALLLGLHWDDGNRQHFRERLRLSPAQVDAGILAGYLFLEPDDIECRFRYLFRPEPSLSATSQAPVYRLIIDTSDGTLRPVTVFEETQVAAQNLYKAAQLRGELE